VFGNNQYFSVIPVEYLPVPDQVVEELGLTEIFGEAITTMIESSDLDLEKEIKILSSTEIFEKLTKYPINIRGIGPDGIPTWPQSETFINELKSLLDELGVPYVDGVQTASSSNNEQPKMGSGGGIKKLGGLQKSQPEETQEEAQVEDQAISEANVVEETPKEEVKTTPKGLGKLSKLKPNN
jgi:hypothetical protein